MPRATTRWVKAFAVFMPWLHPSSALSVLERAEDNITVARETVLNCISHEKELAMKLGFIGAGQVSLAIAKKLISLGHEVALSSRRGPSHIQDRVAVLGSAAQAVTVPEAAGADIVFLAVPWEEVGPALAGLPDWSNRILVDTTNPFVRSATGYEAADLDGRSSSTIVAEHAPRARVVKAFNSILMSNFEKGPAEDGVRRILFVSGDDAPAKNAVQSVIEALGYAVIDLGGLTDGGRMQQGGGPLAGHDLLMFAPWQLNG